MRSYRPISRVGERNAGLFFFAIERLPTGHANPLREPTILSGDRPLNILRGLAKVHFFYECRILPLQGWPTRQG